MTNDANETPTKVIFRKYADGTITALFPEEATSSVDATVCSCYAHLGGHCQALDYVVIRQTKPATPTEYAELKAELERIGYVLAVYQKVTPQMRAAQAAHWLAR